MNWDLMPHCPRNAWPSRPLGAAHMGRRAWDGEMRVLFGVGHWVQPLAAHEPPNAFSDTCNQMPPNLHNHSLLQTCTFFVGCAFLTQMGIIACP